MKRSVKLDGRSKAARALKARRIAAYVGPPAESAEPFVGGTGITGRRYVALETTNPSDAPLASSYQVGGSHYKDLGIEPWDAMQAWMSPLGFQEFLRGHVIKYMARCSSKGGVQDLKKAQHYLQKLIEVSNG